MPRMTVTINGVPRDIPAPATLAAVLAHLGLHAEAVVVEHNRSIVRRAQLATTAVAPGDTLEIVHFVGGG